MSRTTDELPETHLGELRHNERELRKWLPTLARMFSEIQWGKLELTIHNGELVEVIESRRTRKENL